MKIYVMRHGEVAHNNGDSERLLTGYGQASVARLGQFCARDLVNCEMIWHSPLKRAVQTAQIMQNQLGFDGPMLEHGDLKPESDVDVLTTLVQEERKSLLLVSHLPFVDKFVSHLLTGRSKDMVHYRPGTIVALEQIAGQWYLNWCLHPEMIKL